MNFFFLKKLDCERITIYEHGTHMNTLSTNFCWSEAKSVIIYQMIKMTRVLNDYNNKRWKTFDI